jgi:hypothetical protein
MSGGHFDYKDLFLAEIGNLAQIKLCLEALSKVQQVMNSGELSRFFTNFRVRSY